MNSTATAYVTTKLGKLELLFTEQGLSSLRVMKVANTKKNSSKIDSSSKLEKSVISQLERYILSAKPFRVIPLIPVGTDFQKSVWSELSKIPLGETRTYGQIAKKLNSGARAVGNACRRNPIQIIIPCHRVISASDIGGYAGETEGKQLDIKRWLLKHEGVQL